MGEGARVLLQGQIWGNNEKARSVDHNVCLLLSPFLSGVRKKMTNGLGRGGGLRRTSGNGQVSIT